MYLFGGRGARLLPVSAYRYWLVAGIYKSEAPSLKPSEQLGCERLYTIKPQRRA